MRTVDSAYDEPAYDDAQFEDFGPTDTGPDPDRAPAPAPGGTARTPPATPTSRAAG